MDIERDELLQIFFAESEEGLNAMEHCLVNLESRPDDLELLGELFRHAHTFKGNSASLGFQAIAEVTHVLEDLLDRLRRARLAVSSEVVTALLRSVDVLRGLLAAAGAGEDAPARGQALLVAMLGALAEGGEARAWPEAGSGARQDAARALLPQRGRTLRIGVEKLDQLLTLAGEIAIARGRIGGLLQELGEPGRAVLEAHQDALRLDRELQEVVTRARMVPLGPSFWQHQRLVRDICMAAGKAARLAVEGEEVEADHAVVEQLRDPLIHLIRNALDHGVELPHVRLAAGKSAVATISLRAFHEAGQVGIEIADDGAGLDRPRILARARERGLLAGDHQPAPADVDQLIFEPGFSTAAEVTELSGRGVGMDVVRRNIEALRGTVSLSSQPGAGTRVTLRLPLTLAIISAFLVEAGDEVYVLPLDAVAECVELTGERGGARGGAREAAGVANLRGEALPYLRLSRLFETGPARDPAPRENLVVLRNVGKKAGLVVDRPLGETQVVIKALPRFVERVAGISGTTILGDGSVALILDIGLLLREAMARAEAEGVPA